MAISRSPPRSATSTVDQVQVQHLPLPEDTEAAYAVYADSTLARVMVINMVQYNYSAATIDDRPAVIYNFTVPTSCAGHGVVQRLMANGSDAITGITFNGRSYNYELDLGKPQLVGNVTKDEITWIGEMALLALRCRVRALRWCSYRVRWLGRKYFTYLGDLRFRGSWRFGVLGGLRDGV